VKASSRAIEQFRGIPRKIGDLIFAYFDYESPAINVLRATLAGIALARLNEDMNATVSSIDINRYILISSGPALVGNVGGLDSSVEITALGSPVNFLSRLDEATKQHGFSKRLSRGDILLCERSAGLLGQLELEFDWDTIDFASIGVEIRDFPEAKRIYSLKPSHRNWEQANAAYDCLEGVLKTGISANLRARPRSS
jgi:class 3 adenylate cyclase